MASTATVNVQATSAIAIDNFVNAIRQGQNLPLNVALALNNLELAVSQLNKALQTISVSVASTTDNTVTINGVQVTY